MDLPEALRNQKENFLKNVPSETVAIMGDAIKDLSNSGILSDCLKTGEHAPDFTLTDVNNNTIKLSDLLSKGPVILKYLTNPAPFYKVFVIKNYKLTLAISIRFCYLARLFWFAGIIINIFKINAIIILKKIKRGMENNKYIKLGYGEDEEYNKGILNLEIPKWHVINLEQKFLQE